MLDVFTFRAKVVRVVDGDTVDMTVDLGFRISQEIRLRLLGINAPERNAPGGTEATNYLKLLLPIGQQTMIETFKNPTDKYGRWLASIYVNGENINDNMISSGHAVYYEG